MKKHFIVLFLFFIPVFTLSGEEKIPHAYLIANQIKRGLENQEEKYLSAVIQGIEAREKEITLTPEERRIQPIYFEKKRVFLAQKNLSIAEKQMSALQTNKKVHFIIPSKLAYCINKEGTGNRLTGECGKVIVNYVIKKMDGSFPESSSNKKELELAEVIPGFAHGMLSMREGEIRTIYIHPEFAYKSHNFEPNIALEATVELLQILPSNVAIQPLQEATHIELSKVTQDELDQLLLTSYYVLGWKLWDHLKWGYTMFSMEELIAFLKKEPLQDAYDEEVNRVHWKIYQQRGKWNAA